MVRAACDKIIFADCQWEDGLSVDGGAGDGVEGAFAELRLKCHFYKNYKNSGVTGSWTQGLVHAKHALYQLSYNPVTTFWGFAPKYAPLIVYVSIIYEPKLMKNHSDGL